MPKRLASTSWWRTETTPDTSFSRVAFTPMVEVSRRDTDSARPSASPRSRGAEPPVNGDETKKIDTDSPWWLRGPNRVLLRPRVSAPPAAEPV